MVGRTTKLIVLVALAVVGSACSAQAPTATNTTATSAKSSGLPQKTSSQFSFPVSAALGYLAPHESMPLLAPFTISPNLSATATVTKSGYKVRLYRCNSQLPLNSPEIAQPPNCSGLAPYIGEFGGTHYPTAATAKLRLSSSQSQHPGSCGPNTTSSQKVSLAQGVLGVLDSTKDASGYCEMRFQFKGWSVLISGAALYSISEAKREGLGVIDQMAKIRLPAKNGVVTIQTAGDGNHTWLTWLLGQDLYTVSGYHSTSSAFVMAGSTTVVSKGSTK